MANRSLMLAWVASASLLLVSGCDDPITCIPDEVESGISAALTTRSSVAERPAGALPTATSDPEVHVYLDFSNSILGYVKGAFCGDECEPTAPASAANQGAVGLDGRVRPQLTAGQGAAGLGGRERPQPVTAQARHPESARGARFYNSLFATLIKSLPAIPQKAHSGASIRYHLFAEKVTEVTEMAIAELSDIEKCDPNAIEKAIRTRSKVTVHIPRRPLRRIDSPMVFKGFAACQTREFAIL